MKKRLVKSAKLKRLITVLLFVFGAAISITVSILFPIDSSRDSNTVTVDRFPGSGGAVPGQLPGMTEQDIMDQMQREADESTFAFKINTRPVFNNGNSAGALRIENPNHNAYPFVVKLFLNETAEEIYNSGGILPNHHIDTAKLTTPLERGEHAATAYIYAYDPDTGEYCGKAAVDLTVVIESP